MKKSSRSPQTTLDGSVYLDENGGNLGFEEKLWKMADKLRNNMDAGEYKHVVLGLIFLKYISDAFEERYNQLLTEKSEGADPEDKDEYIGYNIFWVPKRARWSILQSSAKQPSIGKIIDEIMNIIEKENLSLKGVLPKDYSRPSLDKQRLGQLIDLIGTIGLGDRSNRSKDILGRVYEYFLGRFASAEGKKGGQFYTPRSIVKLLVEMIEPFHGRIYDPCCGSGGMFVQSEKFVQEHGGKKEDLAIYGQESNPTTWKLCKMNLAIRGIEGNMGEYNADTFRNDIHKELKADFILANPPFNDSDWNGELFRDDKRWEYGNPPINNANYAWIQHIIHHLSPKGIAGFILSNGSLSSDISKEGDIRKKIIEDLMVDCIISLPAQLFYSTSIPACIWIITKGKKNHKIRDKHTLFIDARKMGEMIDRRHRELTEKEIDKISYTYRLWKGEISDSKYNNIDGFCKSVNIQEIDSNKFILTPARYVGVGKEDEEEYDLKSLIDELKSLITKSNSLESRILNSLDDFEDGKK